MSTPQDPSCPPSRGAPPALPPGYRTLRAPHLKVEKHLSGQNARYTVSCDVELGPLQGFVLDAVLYGCVSMGAQLTGAAVPGTRILRRGPEPNHFHRFRRVVGVPVEYGAHEDALVIPVSQLAQQVRFSNEQLAESSREQCEEALKQLTEDAGFACRVRRVIETSHPFPPKLARVASTLFVSERTLKRRLQEEDASFQNLVDQVRLERAQDLLGTTGMNLSQIAALFAPYPTLSEINKRAAGAYFSPRLFESALVKTVVRLVQRLLP